MTGAIILTAIALTLTSLMKDKKLRAAPVKKDKTHKERKNK